MKKDITLERIQVKNLFNRFTYDINLKNGYNVAILIAPNGCGKTTIFNLVDFIFAPTPNKYSKIASVPFDNCTCTLSSGKIICLESRTEKMSVKGLTRQRRNMLAHSGISFDSDEAEEQRVLYLVAKNGKEKHELNVLSSLRDSSEYMDEYDMVRAEEMLRHYPVDLEDISDAEIDRMPARLRKYLIQLRGISNPINDFREKYGCDAPINFINADRLHLHRQIVRRRGEEFSYEMRGEMEDNTPLTTIQRNTKRIYSIADTEYKKLVSEARDKLPKMYIEAHDKVSENFEQFKTEWLEYVADLDKFYELGLIESKQNILEIDQLEEAFKEKGAFLTEYLKAFKPTLEPWHKRYSRMKLFADIINRRNRVTLKNLKYGPEGLIITVDGKPLDLECLSSGEKNDIVMFFNLIFNSRKGGIVLVDEPEISLHIEWQEEYLDCLISICELNKLQAIVATHSPNIVNGHFELYAQRGLQDERRGN